jgi:hypothetical protein
MRANTVILAALVSTRVDAPWRAAVLRFLA